MPGSSLLTPICISVKLRASRCTATTGGAALASVSLVAAKLASEATHPLGAIRGPPFQGGFRR